MEHTHMVVTLTSLLLGTGCTEGVTCPTWSFPAISVHVLATTTGSSLLGALGEVRDGEYRDSLAASGDGTYLAAYDRGGTYAVHIDRRRLLHG